MFDATPWLLIIAAIVTGICTVVNTVQGRSNGRKMDVQGARLDSQHDRLAAQGAQLNAQDNTLSNIDRQTNGTLSAERATNTALRAEIAALKAANVARLSAATEISDEVRKQLRAMPPFDRRRR